MHERIDFSPEPDSVNEIEYLDGAKAEESIIEPKELSEGDKALRKIGKVPDSYEVSKQQKMLFYALDTNKAFDAPVFKNGATITSQGLVYDGKRYQFKPKYRQKIHETIIADTLEEYGDEEKIEKWLDRGNKDLSAAIFASCSKTVSANLNAEYEDKLQKKQHEIESLHKIGREDRNRRSREKNLARIAKEIDKWSNPTYMDANFVDLLQLEGSEPTEEYRKKIKEKEDEIRWLDKTRASIVKKESISKLEKQTEVLDEEIQGLINRKNELREQYYLGSKSASGKNSIYEQIQEVDEEYEKKDRARNGAKTEKERAILMGAGDYKKDRLARAKQDLKNLQEESYSELIDKVLRNHPYDNIPELAERYDNYSAMGDSDITNGKFWKKEGIQNYVKVSNRLSTSNQIRLKGYEEHDIKNEKKQDLWDLNEHTQKYINSLRKKIGSEVFSMPVEKIEEVYFFNTGFLLRTIDGNYVPKYGSPLEEKVLNSLSTEEEKYSWANYWEKKFFDNKKRAIVAVEKIFNEETKEMHSSYDDRIEAIQKQYSINTPSVIKFDGTFPEQFQEDELDLLDGLLPKVAPFINGVYSERCPAELTLKSTRLEIADFLSGKVYTCISSLCSQGGELNIQAFKKLIISTESNANLIEKTDKIMARLTSSIAASLYRNLTAEQRVDFDILVGDKANTSQSSFYRVFQTNINDEKSRREIVKRTFFLKWFNSYINGTSTEDVKEFFDGIKRPIMIENINR